MAKTHAKLFYAAEHFKNPSIIRDTFISIHANKRMLTSEKELQPFFASFGISEDQYQSLFNSFAMKMHLKILEIHFSFSISYSCSARNLMNFEWYFVKF